MSASTNPAVGPAHSSPDTIAANPADRPSNAGAVRRDRPGLAGEPIAPANTGSLPHPVQRSFTDARWRTNLTLACPDHA
ncbi:hypothetical protein LQL77_29595 [Rhodococcus cerastii]|nr:hypothetical protein [Rhodococcus cerastii]